MSQRRMFSPLITDSDAFLEMPSSAQNFYFHLGMRADDDGFVSNPKKVLRMINGADDDLKLLVAKRFVLTFENGVIVIKHWRMNNLIRKDWYRPTIYQEEKASLTIKENGAYTELVNENTTSRHRRLGKVRLGKVTSLIGKGDQLMIDGGTKKTIDGTIDASIDLPNTENDFSEFWDSYSHKVNIKDAKKAWLKLNPNSELKEVIKEDIKNRAKSRAWLEGFQPHFSTYINGERWKDAIILPHSNSKLPTGTPFTSGKYNNEKEIIG